MRIIKPDDVEHLVLFQANAVQQNTCSDLWYIAQIDKEILFIFL